MIDKLNQYHPSTDNLDVAQKQREELYVCKSLSRLRTTLQPLHGQILIREGGIPTLQSIFSRFSQSKESSTTPRATTDTSYVEASALYSSFGYNSIRGRG